MVDDRRTPVTVLTGFLGSGKSTLVRHLLSTPAFSRSAVIVNEFGDIDFSQITVARNGAEVVSANAGCFCCSARAGIVDAFDQLASRVGAQGRFEHVLIETSGVSEPVPILQAVINDPAIVPDYRLNGVITVVDAVTGLESLGERREARRQITHAGAVVLSKIDLADAQDAETLRGRIGELNALAPVFDSTETGVDPALLLAALDDYVEPDMDEAVADNGARHDHAGAALRSWTIVREGPATRTGLAMWMDLMAAYRGSDVLRMKGLINVEGAPVLVESVRHVFHPPVEISDWPDQDRRTRVVVIASGIERDGVEDAFDTLNFQPLAKPLDIEAYTRFREVMGRLQSR